MTILMFLINFIVIGFIGIVIILIYNTTVIFVFAVIVHHFRQKYFASLSLSAFITAAAAQQLFCLNMTAILLRREQTPYYLITQADLA